MKKIYFIVDDGGPIYYMEKPDDWDNKSLYLGYNNSYDRISVCIEKPFFSKSFKDIKTMVDKTWQEYISKLYKQLVDAMGKKYEEEDSIKHDQPCSP